MKNDGVMSLEVTHMKSDEETLEDRLSEAWRSKNDEK